MNHHTDQRFQREARGDVRFPVTTRTAGHRMARNCNAQQGMELQSNAVCALAERAYRVALTRMQRNASHVSAKQVAALPGMAKQRGSELGDRFFSGPLWSECSAMQIKAEHCTAEQGNSKQRGLPTGNSGFSGPLWLKGIAPNRYVMQGTVSHSNGIQSNADRSLATGSFPGRFGPTAMRRNAMQFMALQSIAPQGNSKQRGSGLGNRPFSGPLWLTRPGFLGRFIN